VALTGVRYYNTDAGLVTGLSVLEQRLEAAVWRAASGERGLGG
jgi:hypothetical protein